MAKSETLAIIMKVTFIVIPKFQTSPFSSIYWKFLQIGTLRAKDLRKNVSILQNGGSAHFPHTQPVIRVVLLLTEPMRKDF